MKILVIGNGFDKQHGLKTGYQDFIDFCKAIIHVKEEENICSADQESYNDFIKTYPKESSEFVGLLDNFWIKHFIEVSDIGNRWLDFESEIESITKDIVRERANAKNEFVANDGLSGVTLHMHPESEGCSTYQELFNRMNCDLKRLNRALEIYLCTQIDSKLSRNDNQDVFAKIGPDKLISFNYTRTYFEVYNPVIDACFIHGKADISRDVNECNIVLGFDDHYLKETDTVRELVPFEKYYQRIVNRTGSAYLDWLEEKDADEQPAEKEIYFYGHSMSPADGDVLRSLILCKNAKIKILYRKGHEEERAEMIKNLAVVLTPEELIRCAGGRSPRVEFVGVGC